MNARGPRSTVASLCALITTLALALAWAGLQPRSAHAAGSAG
ncbi:lytic transglycosylase, partial [Burkholderia sp. Tr-862]|nr:lytic transglycosylase [Burkholderia sp. Tr-862]